MFYVDVDKFDLTRKINKFFSRRNREFLLKMLNFLWVQFDDFILNNNEVVIKKNWSN